jgi:hypothetical protein
MIESLPATRLLLLVNYRPEYQHSWGNKTYYTQLQLDPLPSEHAEELLQALVGDEPSLQPLKRVLIKRTADGVTRISSPARRRPRRALTRDHKTSSKAGLPTAKLQG